jgi:hypothetical protein
VNEERRVLSLLGVSNQRPSHIRLVNGIVKVNPHVRVLCPRLARGEDCKRGKRTKSGSPFRPHLLVKNYGNPRLQLWSCEGCKDKFLLRVDLNERG